MRLKLADYISSALSFHPDNGVKIMDDGIESEEWIMAVKLMVCFRVNEKRQQELSVLDHELCSLGLSGSLLQGVGKDNNLRGAEEGL